MSQSVSTSIHCWYALTVKTGNVSVARHLTRVENVQIHISASSRALSQSKVHATHETMLSRKSWRHQSSFLSFSLTAVSQYWECSLSRIRSVRTLLSVFWECIQKNNNIRFQVSLPRVERKNRQFWRKHRDIKTRTVEVH